MKILVLCTGNSCRSQMAEGFLKTFDPRIEALSAGSRPAERVHPFAVRVMEEVGVDLSSNRPKSVAEFLGDSIDYVVTVCDNAERDCPTFSGRVGRRLHIGFPDPADAAGTEEEILTVFRASRDDIRSKFYELYQSEIAPRFEEVSP